MSYLFTIALIGLLVFVHELGHLLAAMAVGIPVERFSVGFGPVLARRRWRGVEYCLSAIPLGGYVMPRIADEAEFFGIDVWRRIVFWLGGPAANFVFAALLLAGANLALDGASFSSLVTRPWIQVASITTELLAVIPAIFMQPDQLSGVVGIVAAGKSVMGGGVLSAVRFAVLLNLNLAVFNLLPIAPLDGGKILCGLLEKVHPRLARLHNGFAVAGLVLLLALMLYTTVLDVMRQLA